MSRNPEDMLIIDPVFEGTDSLIRPKRQIERLLLKPREAAQALSLCEKSLYNLTKRSEIPAVRFGPHGRTVRYDVEDLKAWIRNNKHF